jgi:sulfur carrier protein ThiS
MLEVRIVGSLWEHLEPKVALDLEGRDITVADLIARLGIDQAEVGIVTVDGRQSRMDGIVQPNSRVFIFPPMFGG